MNALVLLAALQLAPGSGLCWMAALPSEGARTPLAAEVLQREPLPTTEPGAWITTPRFPGVQFHVAAKDLLPCGGGVAASGQHGDQGDSRSPTVTVQAALHP